MFKQNVIYFFRSALKDKTSLFINVLGLSAGIICFITFNLYIQYLASFDTFHENKNSLYQYIRHDFDGEEYQSHIYTPYILGKVASQQIPGIGTTVSASSDYSFYLSGEDRKLKSFGKYVSKDFFNLFTYNIVIGDESNPLVDRQSIAISSNLANKLFNTTERVVGKSIEVKGDGNFVISAVFELPTNTFDKFDFVIPIEVYLKGRDKLSSDWTENSFTTYFLLKEGTDTRQLNVKLTALNKENSTSEIKQKISVVRYVDLASGPIFENGEFIGSSSTTVFNIIFFMTLGVLLIACINYTNMATAKAMSRVKEIGIKKVNGASRKGLIIQFFTEIFIITLIACLVSIVITKIILPGFSSLVEHPVSLTFNTEFFLFILGVILFVTFAAGIYPAIYLSRFRPISALRGSVKGSFLDILTRKGLVWFQLFISVFLIVIVLVFNRQIDFLLSKDLGHKNQSVLAIEASGEIGENPDVYLSQLKGITGVASATTIYDGFYNQSLYSSFSWDDKPDGKSVFFNIRRVGDDFFKTAQIQVVEGRVFEKTDKKWTKAILNKEAVTKMGMTDPIGKTITYRDKPLQIVGIVEGVHLIPVLSSMGPLIFINSDDINNVLVRMEDNADTERVLAEVAKASASHNPEYAFEYDFLEDIQLEKFKFLSSLSDLSLCLTLIAIIICFLGIYGLTAFNIERRKKEIGIRKSLGSGNKKIFYNLAFGIFKISGFALLIGFGLGYFLGLSILENNFYYRISVKIWYFIIPMMIIAMAILTAIGLQMSKVLSINPVDYLRDD